MCLPKLCNPRRREISMTDTTDQIKRLSPLALVTEGVITHFPKRASCWFMSVLSIVIGTRLELDPFALNNTSLSGLGLSLVIVGLIRIASLVINGSFKTSWWTAYLRTIMSGTTAILWTQLTLVAFASSGCILDATILPALIVLDVYNTGHSATETKIPWY
jgi:hypothetical protein